MSDSLPTVWRADAHTLAKLRILERYLKAWMPILATQAQRFPSESREVLYVDGFAGPGEYVGGQRGSPVVALEAALHHSRPFPIPIRMVFIEKDKLRFDHLQHLLEGYSARIRDSRQVRLDPPRCGDCDEVLNGLLDQHERAGPKFGPALVFLDQFGYSQVSMDLIRRVLKYPQCEVFTYLNFAGMDRFMTDTTKSETFTRVFGGDEWQPAIHMNVNQRESRLMECYKSALSERGGAKYVVSFAMFDEHERLLYWLFFCTGNLRGIEEMKKAMWKVDSSGEFRFSDKHGPGQLSLLDSYSQEWLAQHLLDQFEGRTSPVSDIYEYVVVETPCHNHIGALRHLEKRGNLTPVDPPRGRRRGSFRKYPHMRVRIQRA